MLLVVALGHSAARLLLKNWAKYFYMKKVMNKLFSLTTYISHNMKNYLESIFNERSLFVYFHLIND